MADKPKKTIDIVSIQWATSRAIDRRAWFENTYASMRDDPGQAKRLDVYECVVCYYSTRPRQHVNVQVTSQCGICGRPITRDLVTTNACYECVRKYRLCSHCGGTIDLRERRKFDTGGPSK